MERFAYTIQVEHGLHGRPAMGLVNAVKELNSQVTVERDGKTSDASKLMALMLLDVQQGQTVTVTVEGGDEAANVQTLRAYFQANL